MKKTDIKNLYLEELSGILSHLKHDTYRAKQILCWIYKHNVTDFRKMTDLPSSLCGYLDEKFTVSDIKLARRRTSADGTEKFLFTLNDNESIETVLMRYRYGNTICVSSQAGCAMGCSFCASGASGLSRNLTVAEMIGQLFSVNNFIKDRHISHVVIMGIGEPLANYDNVIKFIKLTNKDYCFGISLRRITLSTCGIVPGIYRLADENLPITLSISLHAGSNEKRNSLMPINKKYPIEELIKACNFYSKKTKRRVSFEYCLIKNENDTNENAITLSKLLKNKLFHVNLIPLNASHSSALSKPDNKVIQKFRKTLQDNGIQTTIRRSCGEDIDAACGQLRHKASCKL